MRYIVPFLKCVWQRTWGATKADMPSVCAAAQRYIFSVLKEIHPDRSISTRAMGIMNSFMDDMFTRLAAESARLLRMTGKATLSSREVRPCPVANF
jgi:hypothetical protein